MKSNKSVLVIGMNGVGLMPTTPRKARILLQEGKAKVYRKTPFTIRLLYKTGSATQETVLGIDTGSQQHLLFFFYRPGNRTIQYGRQHFPKPVLRMIIKKASLSRLDGRKTPQNQYPAVFVPDRRDFMYHPFRLCHPSTSSSSNSTSV